MKAVIQRVISCSMTVEGKTVFEQGKGLLVLVGVADGDTERDADVLSAKIVKMRIFGDENEKMNRSVTDIGGDIAVVPNFTLLASCRRGNRPDFTESAPPAQAERLFEYFKAVTADAVGKGESAGLNPAELRKRKGGKLGFNQGSVQKSHLGTIFYTDIQLKTFIHGMEVFNMKIIMRRDSVILSKSRNRFRQRRNLSD